MFDGFYKGKRILVTGHTGFKGGWLSLWLNQMGASVYGLAIDPPTNPNLYEIIKENTFAEQYACDIRDPQKLKDALQSIKPDIVFHLAAQAYVRDSYKDPIGTLMTNVMGTAHLLENIRTLQLPSTVIIITSDKCYENVGWHYGYRESDPLGGHDIYSMSKAGTELVQQSYRRSFFEPGDSLGKVASARGGNVIGGGDYGTNRIIPDCVRALSNGETIEVRNPTATRPWQHVLDCLSGYLCMGHRVTNVEKDSPLVSSFNFGPMLDSNKNVEALVEKFLTVWPGEWENTQEDKAPHEAKLLNLVIDKAVALLGWKPTWGFSQSVENTASWYYQRHKENNNDMRHFSINQIEAFAAQAQSNNAVWG